MNKDRFHNALALALGYEFIVKDKRYNIIVDDKADNPRVIVKNDKGYELISFMVDEAEVIRKSLYMKSDDMGVEQDLDMIVDAVHQAYIYATMISFKNLMK